MQCTFIETLSFICVNIAKKLTFFHLNALGFQQKSQPANFIFQFPDKLGVRILIDNGFADNLLGSRINDKILLQKKPARITTPGN